MPGKQREKSPPSQEKTKKRPKLPDVTSILESEGDKSPQKVAPVPEQVPSKMWRTKDFEKKTDEGLFVRQGTAQKNIARMITTYMSDYASGGAISNKNLSKAIELLLQMRQATTWWIDDHTTDVDNGLGGVATVEDPRRKKRMAAMKEFRSFVNEELQALQDQQRKLGDDITNAIAEKHPGFLKLEQRYDGNVRSMLSKVGGIIDGAVPNNGDEVELEIEFQIPCDPSGVGYIGGRLKVEAAKDDDFTKVRAEMTVTGGASVDFAKIGGELGGYLEAQADNASGAMTLVSYGLYRRFKESHVIPEEVSSFLWGGNTGSYGKGKAEKWSLDVEKQFFDTEDEERQKQVYVETGGLAGVGAELDAEVFTGEVGGQITTGRRTDFQSLKNRKGGAGKANKPSDSVIAQGTRALTGGTRGAQKRVGRDVHSASLSSSIEVGLPGVGKLGWEFEGSWGWASDGRSKTQDGVAPTTSLVKNELSLTTTATLSLGDLIGPAGASMLEQLADRVITLVRAKNSGAKGDQASGAMAVLQSTETGMSLLSSALSAADVSSVEVGSSPQVILAVTWDGMENSLTVEIRKAHETSVDAEVVSFSMSRSSRLMKLTYKDGSWTKS